MSGSARLNDQPVSDSRSARGTCVRLAVNLLGGPALSPPEFARYKQGRSMGVA
jgi:hypothetical protein